MTRRERLLEKVLSGRSDAAIRFDDLRRLLLALGFEERTRGSHHLFVMQGIVERINLQRDGSHAKPYQLRQVRAIILKYQLG
ncbi:MAG: type II toxin-antitoxin system HicA family toxin [Alphaproteobacteria bacterium]|nr:type II toxin-antitoxin system HicA family toxin [Alphaproteobacteria bacterium]